MDRLKLPIKDSLFDHAKSSSFWNESDYIEWDRDNDKNVKDYIFLTDLDLHNFNNFPNKKIYAWLLESPEITPKAYEFVKLNNHIFDKIFTFDEEILKFNNSFFLPFGGSMLDKSDIKLFDKNKNVSMMFSWKRDLVGHKLRHIIYNLYRNKIDFYGSGVNGINVKKINSVKDYRFSVVVENCKKNYYFTEKIIDCFLTGTIPIYWGCPSIGDFFDTEGIIVFNNENELNGILESLNIDIYNKMYKSVVNNFNQVKKYVIAEDYLYNNYKNLI